MARVRVFLLTHRRPELLRRALRSLLAQTFTDWVCELHNDAPGDAEPRALLAELAPGDPRLTCHDHEQNWGAVAAFNHAYAGGPEPLAALLEDDNWWEPQFLENAVHALDSRPEAALAWANMRIWREAADGAWADTGHNVWQTTPATSPLVEFRPPEIFQAFDALHSQGAMVFRPEKFSPRSVPPTTPLAIIEPVRERAAVGSLLLLTAPMAHFALTRDTARETERARWLQSRLLLAASFFHTARPDAATLETIWTTRRARRPRATDLLFHLALALRAAWPLRSARAGDWLYFLTRALASPRVLARGRRFRTEHPIVWDWLVAHAPTSPVRATVITRQL